MSKIKKKIDALRNNPKADWQMSDLKSIADHLFIDYVHKGTSHVVFKRISKPRIVIPAHKPIKSCYIKQFLEILEGLEDV